MANPPLDENGVKHLNFLLTQSDFERLQNYMEKSGHKQSPAIRQLVRKGLEAEGIN